MGAKCKPGVKVLSLQRLSYVNPTTRIKLGLVAEIPRRLEARKIVARFNSSSGIIFVPCKSSFERVSLWPSDFPSAWHFLNTTIKFQLISLQGKGRGNESRNFYHIRSTLMTQLMCFAYLKRDLFKTNGFFFNILVQVAANLKKFICRSIPNNEAALWEISVLVYVHWLSSSCFKPKDLIFLGSVSCRSLVLAET